MYLSPGQLPHMFNVPRSKQFRFWRPISNCKKLIIYLGNKLPFFVYPKWRRRSEPWSWQGGPAPRRWRWSPLPKSPSAGGQPRWRDTLPRCGCPSPGNTLSGLLAWSSPTNQRTARLGQPGVQTGYHEGWAQEGCNWWWIGDRYWPLRSGRSRWGWARWGETPQWDRREPTDQSEGRGGSGGKSWEQKVVLEEEKWQK